MLVLILMASIANPIPNLLHYAPLIYLTPICLLIILLLIFGKKNSIWIKGSIYLFTILIGANMLFKLSPSMAGRIVETILIKRQMMDMKNSQRIYEVDAKSFYSNLLRLKEYEVPFKKVKHLSCAHPHLLELSNYTTYFCP